MKHISILFLLFAFFSANAQYTIDRINAPQNPLPLKYTKAHFGLKGAVEKTQINLHFLEFNAKGNLLSEYNQGSYKYSYDAKGFLIKQNYEGSYPIEYTIICDVKGRIIKISDGKEDTRTYTYNSQGLLIQIDYKSGSKTTHTYDDQGRISASNSEFLNYYYTYTSSNGFLKVDRKRIFQDDVDAATTTTIFYTDKGFEIFDFTGRYLNTYDEQGNPINGVNDGWTNEQTHTYYGQTQRKGDEIILPSSVEAFGANCISGDCKNGWGKTVYLDGSFYEGFWNKGFRNGYGTFNSATFLYAGEWKNHNINGVGYGKTQTENLFGNFKNAELNGYAYRTSAEKTTIGYFSNDHCSFPQPYASNNVSKGCIMGDCDNSFGRYVYEDGKVFEGFSKEKNWVLGELKLDNSSHYQGEFKDGEFHGFGRYQDADGTQYSGEWEKGKYHGLGFYQEADGKNRKIGLWEKGVLVKAM